MPMQLGPAAKGSPEDLLELAGLQPVAVGVKRLIFQHPEDSSLLIKVLRPEFVHKRFGPGGSFHNRHRRCRHYNYFLRELREYLVACARSPESVPLLAEVVGLVHTDLGLGLIAKKITGADGRLAPTIGNLVAAGMLDEARWRRFEHFQQVIVASDIVLDDLHPGNVVLTRDTNGEEHFMLVDGLGSSTAIPLKALVRPLNRWSKQKEFARLRALLTRPSPPKG